MELGSCAHIGPAGQGLIRSSSEISYDLITKLFTGPQVYSQVYLPKLIWHFSFLVSNHLSSSLSASVYSISQHTEIQIRGAIRAPVVQSFVSLTSSLRVISLTVLANSIHNILIFFAEKMWVAFALQKLLTFFQQKISEYLRIARCKF